MNAGLPFDPAKEESAKRSSSVAVLCFVGGGVGLAAGALMYLLAPEGTDGKTSLRLDAAPLPGGALAGLSARW